MFFLDSFTDGEFQWSRQTYKINKKKRKKKKKKKKGNIFYFKNQKIPPHTKRGIF